MIFKDNKFDYLFINGIKSNKISTTTMNDKYDVLPIKNFIDKENLIMEKIVSLKIA